jgi:hypothetical protein
VAEQHSRSLRTTPGSSTGSGAIRLKAACKHFPKPNTDVYVRIRGGPHTAQMDTAPNGSFPMPNRSKWTLSQPGALAAPAPLWSLEGRADNLKSGHLLTEIECFGAADHTRYRPLSRVIEPPDTSSRLSQGSAPNGHIGSPAGSLRTPSRSSAWCGYPKQARVPFQRPRRVGPYPGRVRVSWIDHIVWLARYQCGRHPKQSAASIGGPPTAGCLSLRATQRSPVVWRIVHQILDRKIIGRICLYQNGALEVAPLNQTLKHSERQ